MKKLNPWKKFLKHNEEKLRTRITDLDFSALEDWYEDCYVSFKKIYEKYSKVYASDKYNSKLDTVVDIHLELQHIKRHIDDSEKGFLELMSLTDEAQSNNKSKKFKKHQI